MMDMSGEYNTALSPEDEQAFQNWAKDNNRQRDTYDYDMRGWWNENINPGMNPDFAESLKSHRAISKMVDPVKFEAAVQTMPQSSNIEDRRPPEPKQGEYQTMNNPMQSIVHLTDKYKKPNHPTFSNESMYHGSKGLEGGVWSKQGDGSFVFIPGKTNLENFGPEGLQNYFNQFEKGNSLILPKE